MTQFPDLSTLKKTDDGSEFIYGGSVGINRILGLLRNTAFPHPAIDWRVWFINVSTLVRNAFAPTATPENIRSSVALDCNLLSLYISAYSTQSLRRDPISIIFYIPSYEFLPSDIRRPLEGRALQLEQASQWIYSHFPVDAVTEVTSSPHTRVFVARVGGATTTTAYDISAWMASHATALRIRTNDPVALVSHRPLDWHVARRLHAVSLVESYTGSVRHVVQFGERLFKSDTIPFYPTTHRLFGDGVDVRPFVSGKPRAQLIEHAKLKKWNLMSETEIIRDAAHFLHIKTSDLKRIKM